MNEAAKIFKLIANMNSTLIQRFFCQFENQNKPELISNLNKKYSWMNQWIFLLNVWLLWTPPHAVRDLNWKISNFKIKTRIIHPKTDITWFFSSSHIIHMKEMQYIHVMESEPMTTNEQWNQSKSLSNFVKTSFDPYMLYAIIIIIIQTQPVTITESDRSIGLLNPSGCHHHHHHHCYHY